MYRRLFVPLDGSERAEQALPHARGLAEPLGASMVLVRAVVPVPQMAPDPALATGQSAQLIADSWVVVRTEAQQYLQQVRPRLPAELQVETEVVDGPASESLLVFADRAGVDLIVMTTHGHSGLAHLVFGSTAEQMLHRTRIPLLLIRVA